MLPNAYVTVMIKQTFKQAVKILKDYVWLEENGSFVYVIRNGKIEKIEINILADGNTFFIVKDTFSPADLLIMQNINIDHKLALKQRQQRTRESKRAKTI